MARISELHYSDAYAAASEAEFLEVALGPGEDPADFTVSFYNADGTLAADSVALTDPLVRVTVDPDSGETAYVISSDDFPFLLTDPDGSGAGNSEAVALTDTSAGGAGTIDFYDIGGGTQNIVATEGPAAGETSENLAVLVGPQQTTTTLQFNQPDPDTLVYGTLDPGDTGIICFTPGARIAVPGGTIPVEHLRPGHLVCTMDDGPQPIRWIGRRSVPATGALAPIRIPAGHHGASEALLVSPQHRMLMRGPAAQLHFGDEVLVPAAQLVGAPGVHRRPGGMVTYIHLMFDRHQVIWANDAPCESFFVSDVSRAAMGDAMRDEFGALFPDLLADGSGIGPLARMQPPRAEIACLHGA